MADDEPHDVEAHEDVQLIQMDSADLAMGTTVTAEESPGLQADAERPHQTHSMASPKAKDGDVRKGSTAAESVLPSTLFSSPVHTIDNVDIEEEEQFGLKSPSADKATLDDELENKTKSPPSWFEQNKPKIVFVAKILFLLFWIAYSIAAFVIDFHRARILFIIEMIVIGVLILNKIYNKWLVGVPTKIIGSVTQNRYVLYAIYTLLVLTALGLIIYFTYQDIGRLVALGGLLMFIAGSWAFSWNRKAIKWRPVIWGFTLQFTFGLVILRTAVGYELFLWIGDIFKGLLDFTLYGSSFTFGYLATGKYWFPDGPEPFAMASVFAFSVIPTVIFFGALVSVLYYLGALQFIIKYLSKLMQYTLGTSSSESLNAAGNIFVGMTEAPLLIKPFLPTMTRSELHAVMTGGFATIAGGVMAIYISFGVPPAHLLSASVMSAPAALAISKIVYPEDCISPTAAKEKKDGDEEDDEDSDNELDEILASIGSGDDRNVIEAAANGAAVAIGLAANIVGMLIAFLAIIELLNYLFSYWGSLIDWDITFSKLCGYLFFPIAFMMGVHPNDCQIAGQLIGIKVVANEFVAYTTLQGVIGEISGRTYIILIYALCGFSNFGSIGITLGGLSPLAPHRTKDMTELVLSAMISGNVACFMTACIAALLFDPDRY